MNFKKLFGYIELLLGAGYIFLTTTIRDAPFGNPDAPKLFSYGLGGLLMVAGLASVIRDWREPVVVDRDALRFAGEVRFIALVCLCLAGYILIFQALGYILSTILFFTVILLLFDIRRRLVKNAIVAVVFTFSMFFLFSELLGIRLPELPALRQM